MAIISTFQDQFKINWITIAETRYSCVGHLKNALNKNQLVFVGRDGQEIERECGSSPCEIIDEEDARMKGAAQA
ncbi:MAG: hypothetical protein M1827_003162 [Pycnora praestabilis]|nr:MAG: hypothetical protein M1827_003162 [Pycnora praestabilis]